MMRKRNKYAKPDAIYLEYCPRCWDGGKYYRADVYFHDEPSSISYCQDHGNQLECIRYLKANG